MVFKIIVPQNAHLNSFSYYHMTCRYSINSQYVLCKDSFFKGWYANEDVEMPKEA